jgi:hypothetical protein
MSQERFVRIILIFSSQKTKMVPSMGQTIPLLKSEVMTVFERIIILLLL